MNLKQYGLIGKQIRIVNAKNRSLIGIKGKVVDETKNLIIFDNGKKIVRAVVEFEVLGNEVSGTLKSKAIEVLSK